MLEIECVGVLEIEGRESVGDKGCANVEEEGCGVVGDRGVWEC